MEAGRFAVTGARSPHTLFAPDVAVYGEENHPWSGDEARAFARISRRSRAARRAARLTWSRPLASASTASPARPATRALASEVTLGADIVAAEGYVLAVRILADKTTYNTVEDVHGRMVPLREGDVLAGTLGERRALRGYAGVVPERIAVGDTLEVLNLGGILGRSQRRSIPSWARRSRLRCSARSSTFPALGDRIGRPAHIREGAVPSSERLLTEAPVVYVAGTCMNSGKTVAATELVRGLSRSGLRVAARSSPACR